MFLKIILIICICSLIYGFYMLKIADKKTCLSGKYSKGFEYIHIEGEYIDFNGIHGIIQYSFNNKFILSLEDGNVLDGDWKDNTIKIKISEDLYNLYELKE